MRKIITHHKNTDNQKREDKIGLFVDILNNTNKTITVKRINKTPQKLLLYLLWMKLASGEKITLESQKALAEKLNTHLNSIKPALRKLQSLNYLTLEKVKNKTVVEINTMNYDIVELLFLISKSFTQETLKNLSQNKLLNSKNVNDEEQKETLSVINHLLVETDAQFLQNNAREISNKIAEAIHDDLIQAENKTQVLLDSSDYDVIISGTLEHIKSIIPELESTGINLKLSSQRKITRGKQGEI